MNRKVVTYGLPCALLFAAPARADDANQDAPAPPAPEDAKAQEKPDETAPAAPGSETPAPDEQKSDLEQAIESQSDANPFVMPGEIVVSGKQGGVPLAFPHQRDVVDKQTLQTYPQGSITEALRHVPGVFIQSDAGNDIKMSIGIRGQQARLSAFTAVLVDGIPVKQTLYGVVDLDILPFTFERAYRIDVIEGGADLRYGPNAYGGVINFITAPIPERPTLTLRGAYGSDNEYSTMVETGATQGQFGVLVTGVYKGGDGWRDHSEYHQEDGSAKFRFLFDDKNEVSGSINRYVEEIDFASGITQQQFEENPEQARAEHDYGRGDVNRYNARFVHTFSRDAVFETVVWYHRSFREFSLAQPVLPPFVRQNHQPANYQHRGVEAKMSWSVPIFGLKNSFYNSLRYYDDRANRFNYTQPYDQPFTGPRTIVSDADFTTQSFALFNEDVLSITDTVDLTLGLRNESIVMTVDNLVTGAQANSNYSLSLPEAALSWRFLEKTAAFTSWSEGFATPLYNTMDPSNPSYNPNLKPEDAENTELGVRSREFKGFEASAVYFKQDYEDKIERSSLPDGTARYFNSQSSNVDGIVLAASYDVGGIFEPLEGLAFYGNYTKQQTEIEHGSSAPGAGDDLAGKRLPNAPDVLTNFGARYMHSSGLWARITRSHTGDYYSDALNSPVPSPDGVNGYVPAFTLWDAAIGWNQNKDGTGLAVSVGCTNLFDNDTWFRRNATGIQPGAPRRFNATASYTFQF